MTIQHFNSVDVYEEEFEEITNFTSSTITVNYTPKKSDDAVIEMYFHPQTPAEDRSRRTQARLRARARAQPQTLAQLLAQSRSSKNLLKKFFSKIFNLKNFKF